MAEIKKTFIFFESWERYLKTLSYDKDRAYVNEVCRAIVQYALYGECETQDETILQRIDAVCSDLMQSSKARYASAVANGRSGGRPVKYDANHIRQLRDTGMTYEEIANNLGCSVRTVQRALEDYNKWD